MARRRDSPLIFDIDTGADGSSSGGPDDGPSVAEEPTRRSWFTRRVTGPARERWQALSRRTRRAVVAGATALAVLGTGTAVVLDARADAALAAHMVEQPGGVADLSVPWEQTWRVETDGGPMAVLDGGLLLARSGPEAIAVDAATGDIAWRHDLGELMECGSGHVYAPLNHQPVDQVVCLTGSPQRTATVIAADGEILGTRDLGEVSSTLVWNRGTVEVAAAVGDDGIAVGRRVDVDLTATDVETALAELDEMRAAGTWQPVSVRVEDALTGEVRGEVTLDLTTAEDVAGCLNSAGTGDGTVWITSEPHPYAGGINVSLCEQRVVLESDGSTAENDRQPFGDGYAEDAGDGRTLVVDGDGTETVVDGWIALARADDGFDVPLLAWGPQGGLTAYLDGEQRWTAELEINEILVAAAGTIVVGEGSAVVGLDAATGERLWTHEDAWEPNAFLGGSSGSLTDGRAALLTGPGEGGTARFVALDLTDGAVRWQDEIKAPTAGLLAVDGHAVVVENDGNGYTIGGDGDSIEFADTALVGYAAP
jgi:outer membrane protein assembly factor BamB